MIIGKGVHKLNISEIQTYEEKQKSIAVLV